ncbi:formylmethanofuran dehydrogenase subunit B [Archaeoglobales archaeon]|nr:MAG: formylmethanofuran dehydrogenase subunit B [Archaeoglobales archaeon]
MPTCTGCSCLCPDIVIKDSKVFNACRKGSAIFKHCKENRAEPTISGEKVDFGKALEKAVEIISSSEKLAVYGLDTIPLEAQEIAIKLAEKKKAYIDDSSAFCLGDFVEMVLKGILPTTTLDEVKSNAYVIFYWGTDPYNSLSRHLSLYTYYPRAGKRQRGYEEDRYLVVVDVRKSHTAKLVKKNAKFIKVDSDEALIEGFLSTMDGKAGKYYEETGRILKEMQRGGFNAIFGGLGLKYGLNGNYEKFVEMVKRMNELTQVYFIPAGFHANMRGFNELMFEKTGFVNRYSFESKKSSPEYEFSELVRNDSVDTVLVIGSDPANSLPFDVLQKLREKRLVLVDPKKSLTSKIAEVVVPSAITGIDQGGTMVRSDGVRIEIEPLWEAEWTDEAILKELLGEVK